MVQVCGTAMVLAGLCLMAAAAGAGEGVQMRDGLSNTFAKLAKGERTVVAYFGGSITAGAGASKPDLCYRSLLSRYLREQFPKSEVVEVNAAIGGTASWLGAFRLKQDVLDRRPDLVIVEFAVNDGGDPEAQVLASMDGIVRQIRKANPLTDILFVYTLVKGHMDAFQKGGLPDRMQWHERIATHYGIPSVNMAQHAAAQVIAGKLTFDEFARDGVHPTDRGYALYLEALQPFVAQCKTAAAQPAEARPHPLPAPLTERPMERAQLASYELAEYDVHWKAGDFSPVDRFTHVLSSDTPGATATLRFRGDCAGYFDALGPDTGDLEVSVDGGPWQPRPNWDPWARGGYRAHCRVLAKELDPAVPHEVKVRIAEAQPKESKGRFARFGYFLVNGDLLAKSRYEGMTPLQRIDAVYAGMAPVKYEPPASRWTHIPNAVKRLQEGPSLRIVMLGDSIVNDTGHSQYEHLLMRHYPKCKVERIMSVRGSTGCWWYKEENRIQEWVVAKQPDLLIIGGISQRDDVDSIREVIHQVRAAMNPAPEVFLMTGAFGANTDPRRNPKWQRAIDPNGTDYRARLMRLAAEEKAEFLDLNGAWGEYVQASDKAIGWFMRDAVHANDRGFQILGRIVERYLSPK